ncbi:type I restriction endonuclease subunit R [Vagococcus carniphilus]|uniref:Type I restriction enzyme endonuclease subunit n=1 Tax=Vagococcus carniphilus TaxID=218144 RepID=A0A430APZ6_9ENTE|nr:HsdR family type I site-specific deoxyribonuclease [Vagococcus carniphilus]QNN72559.1 type I restriction endonuclease subunit R [Vagococcus carniphilus]RSU10201.1 deoxyribonuclease [Vagococcus carniphilus]
MDIQKNELEVEKRLIKVLGEGHNQWTYRPDLKSEADLWRNLRQKISQNNVAELDDVPLTDDEFERIKVELLSKTRTPFDAAKWLKGENGIARITIERDADLGVISLVLFTRDYTGGISSYEVVNQIATQNINETGHNRRFDVTLLINGLPIVQIELKQVSAKDGVFQAFNQIKKYAEEGMYRNNIFSTLQLFVVSNEKTTRYFANALPTNLHKKFMFSWRTKDNKKVDDVYEFVKQMLNIPDAHKLIADYTIVSEDQDNKVLMVLHPYQIHAIEELYTSAAKHQSGYIWHATGSGKTLTSFVSTKLLARKSGVDRTIMLIDRKDLDNQTTSEFTKFASEYNTGISSGVGKSNSLIVGTGSARELSQVLLSDTNSNTVIITTRQKLDSAIRYAEKIEAEKGTKRFEKLKGQHIVFVVDECHRAVSSEGMEEVKKYFPQSTWFGFTGTPIFEVNKKQAKGKLARTTDDQYGDCLHTYTIKNALEDEAVLGFQVEHDDTVDNETLYNSIFTQLLLENKYQKKSHDEINKIIDQMDGIEKETYMKPFEYETEEHIKEVIKKIFKPNDAYNKFDFKNGLPQKSAILTTNSIEMAKRYYYLIKEMTSQENWIEKVYGKNSLRMGRLIEDKDFPRIAITYSVQENEENASVIQKEMAEIIETYNDFYGTSWDIKEIERYNGDINNRLARKKGEFKQFGQHLDLVIVVDRLLTGFDAPTIQTLFVDRNMSYANLIQAFSRTNRTYPDKKKGMIVTFRYPHTMEKNVEEATLLYSHQQEQSGLIYPTYQESKKRFLETYQELTEMLENFPEGVDEHDTFDERVDYVQHFQTLNNAFEALVTYNEYNEEIIDYDQQGEPLETELGVQVNFIEEEYGNYETVKGSLIAGIPPISSKLSMIEFFDRNNSKVYNIDSAYINQLLGNYSANSQDIREEIEKALAKMNKTEQVKSVYRNILNKIDTGEVSADGDILILKRVFFTTERDRIIREFADEWCVSESELHTSGLQYEIGMSEVPNIKKITKSRDLEKYREKHPDVKPFKYNTLLKKAWIECLESTIIPFIDELK